MFVNYDEEKQKEKRIANYFYVHAASLPEALKTLQEEEMKNWQTDYDIVAVTDTPIMDVYLYSPDTQNKK